MKLYLSSYKVGQKADELKAMLPAHPKVAFIPNAIDEYRDTEEWRESNERNMRDLDFLEGEVVLFDLVSYFGKTEQLKQDLSSFDLVWVRGGNTFVLRQAMALSGFDQVITSLFKNNDRIVYGGYSAGVCVLAPDLYGLQQVDDPSLRVYGDDVLVIWEGLGLLPYLILPHYRSDHPESALIEKEVEYMIEQKKLFLTLKDGEVLVV